MIAATADRARATVAVAFSGGRDSLALLHATVRGAAALGIDVVALHVHHGLVAEADAWVRSTIALCARWQRRGWAVRLRWHRVTQKPAPGDSIERWAREQRHAALAQMAREEGATMLLLAQHRRDQAETVLLQALRGAGPKGLAAMPRMAQRDGLWWARPWLEQPREAIEAYVRRHRLKPIEDPSNADERFARNRLRAQAWPGLRAAFPDADSALASAARRAHEADAALGELAAMDLARCAGPEGLQLAPWLGLSPARRANALRAWLAQQMGRGAPESLVQRVLTQWTDRSPRQWPGLEGWTLASYRGTLTWRRQRPSPGSASTHPAAVALDLSRPGWVELPAWGGGLELVAVDQGGVAVDRLRHVELRSRSGGEQFQRVLRGVPRSLKKQYQAAGVPPNERDGPLVWGAGALLFVPGLGVDARVRAPAGEPQLSLRWVTRTR